MIKYKFFVLLIAALGISACNEVDFEEYFAELDNTRNYPELFSAQTNYVTDLCLIYNGRPSGIKYTKEIMRPYVYYTDKQGNPNFLFDGFLMLEIVGPDGRPIYTQPDNTNTTLWNWYLDKQFQEGIAISAINQVLDSLAKQNVVPERKRKIVMGIPVPYQSNMAFGLIGGKEMKLNTVENRAAATKWFIDETLRRWDEKNYQHLELAGFYYNEEHARDKGDSIIPITAQYIKSKSKTFYWIPYFGGQGAKDWKKLGFDVAYQQPNYFFTKSTVAGMPATRINDATHFASKYGMALEFEFDDNITDTLYQRKFNEYYNGFVKEKVFDSAPIAYYEGGGAWYRMCTNPNAKVNDLYHKLAEMIISRQKKADLLN